MQCGEGLQHGTGCLRTQLIALNGLHEKVRQRQGSACTRSTFYVGCPEALA